MADAHTEAQPPAFLLDLDGTLVDNVYQHVMAWQQALEDMGVWVPVWRIHRRIGISAELMTRGVLREGGHEPTDEQMQRLKQLHGKRYVALRGSVRPLPGARELLDHLDAQQVPWIIASSSPPGDAEPMLDIIGLPADTPMVTGHDVTRAKPDPDLFLTAAARLGVDPNRAVVVGDSIWDLLAAQRAGALGLGLLCGGYSRNELERAGAYRVYQDPADLLQHIDELGVPNPGGAPGPST
jgi:HAD superfamily hydrolase (TIGR01509 family)